MPTQNLVDDFGGVGDAQRQTVNITVASGDPTLTVGTAIFVSGDAGKMISVWNGNNFLNTTISSFTSSTEVELASNFTWNATTSSSDVLWGTDNTDAFTGASGWRAYAQTQTNPADIPILEIPDGSYAYRSSAASGGALHYNVLNSVKVTGISGVAANCKLMQFSNGEMRFGTDVAVRANRGLQANTAGIAGNSVRLQTVAATSPTVTLSNPSGTDAGGATYGNRIVVGRTCLIAAFDLQCTNEGEFGYPPNNYYFEWNKITAYDSGTGVVTLETPTTQQYKSTFPRWSKETTLFAADQGGPATLWVCPDGYNNTVTLENIMIDSPHNQCACHMRYVVLNNLDMNGGPGLYPTQCDIMEINDSVYTAGLEVDKLTNQVTWNNCTLNTLTQQSASPNRMIVNGGTINQLGTAKYTEANGVAFTGVAKVNVGVTSYGRAERLVLNNCTDIVTFQRSSASTDDLGGTPVHADASDFYTFVDGVIKFLKTENDSAGGTGQQNLTRLFVPGTWILFDDKYIDQISDVYEDGTYCYVKFARTTDWPFTPVSRLSAHPCPDVTLNNCTGTAYEVEDYNNAPARTPWMAYSKRTYVAGASAATAPPSAARPILVGKLSTIKLTVTSLFTGGSALTFKQMQFDNGRYLKTSDYSLLSNLGNTINMKTGLNQTRLVANQAAGSNAQSGDTLFDFSTLGSDAWFYVNALSSPVFSANVTNGDTPTVTVEWIMDQGIPPAIPTAVVPLRLRLRA